MHIVLPNNDDLGAIEEITRCF